MVTISRVVEKIVEDSPFIQEAIAKGIVNYASLAESIKSRVEIEMKQEVKESAIMMALRRLATTLEKKFYKHVKFDRHSDITIKSNLFDIVVKRNIETQKKLKEIYSLAEDTNIFLTITQGPHEIDILASDLLEEKIESLFSKSYVEKKITKLCGLTINIPKELIEEPGFFYIVTRALTIENINIIDLVSTLSELTIIVEENSASRSFEVLRELINKNK